MSRGLGDVYKRQDLIRYHELDLEPEWGALTKSRASRMIDQIILAHGRMEKRQRTEKK